MKTLICGHMDDQIQVLYMYANSTRNVNPCHAESIQERYIYI